MYQKIHSVRTLFLLAYNSQTLNSIRWAGVYPIDILFSYVSKYYMERVKDEGI